MSWTWSDSSKQTAIWSFFDVAHLLIRDKVDDDRQLEDETEEQLIELKMAHKLLETATTEMFCSPLWKYQWKTRDLG